MKTCTRCRLELGEDRFQVLKKRGKVYSRNVCKACNNVPLEELPPGCMADFDIDEAAPPLMQAEAAIAERNLKATLRQERDAAVEEVAKLRKELQVAAGLSKPIQPYNIAPAPASHGAAVACMVASDWHIEEPVEPAKVHGINEYSMGIAHKRAAAFFRNGLRLTDIMGAETDIDTIWLGFLGDFISGHIHEELRETNSLAPGEAIREVQVMLASGIDFMLANSDYKLVIDCVPGNHGRMTLKPRIQNATETSLETFMYHSLASRYAGNPRVEFNVAASKMLYRRFFSDFTMRVLHGDDVKFGGGVGGITIPIRKKLSAWDMAIKADLTVMGHFHQLFDGGNFLVNGCFPAGSLVTTPTGVCPIEQVQIGDAVLSRDGSIQTVTGTTNPVSEQGLVHLKVRGLPAPITATPNHHIWAIKGESKSAQSAGQKWDGLRGGGDAPQWIPANYLSPGDYVHIPRPKTTGVACGTELAWMYGLYLAEGCTLLDAGSSKRHHRIAMTMHEKELPILQRWCEAFRLAYGFMPRFGVRKRRSIAGGFSYVAEATVSPGRDLCVKFLEDFGHRAHGKRIPDWLMAADPDVKRALVQGWIDGDGHTNTTGQTSATTVSKTLAHQMFLCALSAGFVPSMASLAPSPHGRRKSETWTIHFQAGQETVMVDGELYYRVQARYRDRQVVPVYDLEVSGEHTYSVGFVGVHNSLIGYNEFAQAIGASPEEARQAFFLVHNRNGGEKSVTAPIWLDDAHHAP